MLGILPSSVVINGVTYKLNTDYHIALIIFEALEDPNLTEQQKMYIMLSCLYEDYKSIPEEFYKEAVEEANKFLNGGENYDDAPKQKPLFSWTQDANIIFDAVNIVAGKELRDENNHEHWYTFLSYMGGIKESTFSTYIGIRKKLNKGKKLEKWEEDILRNNRDGVILKTRLSDAEQAELDRINKMLGGG